MTNPTPEPDSDSSEIEDILEELAYEAGLIGDDGYGWPIQSAIGKGLLEKAEKAITEYVTAAVVAELKSLLPTYQAELLENNTELLILRQLVELKAIRPELAGLPQLNN